MLSQSYLLGVLSGVSLAVCVWVLRDFVRMLKKKAVMEQSPFGQSALRQCDGPRGDSGIGYLALNHSIIDDNRLLREKAAKVEKQKEVPHGP